MQFDAVVRDTSGAPPNVLLRSLFHATSTHSSRLPEAMPLRTEHRTSSTWHSQSGGSACSGL